MWPNCDTHHALLHYYNSYDNYMYDIILLFFTKSKEIERIEKNQSRKIRET